MNESNQEMGLRNLVKRGVDAYVKKNFEGDSIYPLLHVCFYGMAFSYLVALPEELRHLDPASGSKAAGNYISK